MKEDLIPIETGYYSISCSSSSDSRWQRVLGGDTWNNGVFRLVTVLYTDIAVVTAINRGYWEEPI